MSQGSSLLGSRQTGQVVVHCKATEWEQSSSEAGTTKRVTALCMLATPLRVMLKGRYREWACKSEEQQRCGLEHEG